MIRAVRLLSDHANLSLDVIGDGSLLPELRRLAASLGIDDRVRFHGKVAQAGVVDLLANAHIFCYPTTASEGFPKVVLEALACGLPVITTHVSVLPQLVRDCGILIDDATPEALAFALKSLLSDPQGYRALSTAAIRTAKAYTLEKWRDTIGEILKGSWGETYDAKGVTAQVRIQAG